tara:strand:+ start:478 stop:828 length:351 start_codon:yes stop_codon:yes gene_type:complete
VFIIFKTVKEPKRYEPPSPKKSLAFGKLNNKNIIKIIICAIKNNRKFNSAVFRLIDSKMKLIINICIPSKPLKPSIKFAPLIINKKHRRIKIKLKSLLDNHIFRNSKSTLTRFIEK